MATQSQVDNWVNKSLAGENLKDFAIKITGSSEKGEGYLGDIIFVEAEGTNLDDEPNIFYLVVKHAKLNKHFRKAVPVKLIFENEIYLYTTVIPAFQEFQREKHVEDVFDCVPKCFYSSSSDDMEVLVLENLKMAGFQQYDRKKPMNPSHCRAVLEQYGKFHAISFAMREQNRERFTAVVSKLQDTQLKTFETVEVGRIFDNSRDFVLDMLEENGDFKLQEKLLNLLRKGAHVMIKEVLNRKDSQSVITHGDCWCNNFLFKYGEGDKDSPPKAAIIDWQLSAVRSPVFDLSYFFYAVCSKSELDSFEELLKFYHESFTTHLAELGSDPEKLFPYSDLRRHWKEYSIFGLINVMCGLRVFICNKSDTLSFDDIGEDANFLKIFDNITYDGDTLLYDRMKAVVSHYFDFLDGEF